MRRPLTIILLAVGAVVLAAVVVFAVVAAGGGDLPGPPNGRATTGPTTASPTTVPTDTQLREPLPIGTIEPAAFDEGDPCPEGHDCRQFVVSCPAVQEPARVSIAVARPDGEARGTVAFFSGGGGRDWWGSEGSSGETLQEIRGEGLATVQVRWKDEWLGATQGDRAGPERLACRSATVIRWIHDEVHERLGAGGEPGRCGFCLTGTSGGASQIAFALAFYGQGELVDVLVPTGGPPHAALDKGCRRDPQDREFWYVGASTRTIDASWGFRGGREGPCVANDESFTETWRRSSVELGGSDYDYPTRVVVIVGERDRILPHARAYVDRLSESGTEVTLEVVPGMGHSIADSPQGLEVLARALRP